MFKEAFQSADQPEGGTKISGGKKTALLTAGISFAGIIFTLGIAHAMFGGESLEEKISRLEFDYANQVEIINRADEVIEKQYDIKMRADRTLKSVSIELSNAKSQVEMQKETPDMNEVRRLSEKAASYAQELGN